MNPNSVPLSLTYRNNSFFNRENFQKCFREGITRFYYEALQAEV